MGSAERLFTSLSRHVKLEPSRRQSPHCLFFGSLISGFSRRERTFYNRKRCCRWLFRQFVFVVYFKTLLVIQTFVAEKCVRGATLA